MIAIRKSEDRGNFNHGWLKTYHTFSFGEYNDPDCVRFHNLRVINEDYIAPGEGFGTHSHQDMEIITYVLEGALEHKDSMGNTSAIRSGEVQRMSAGTGVTHSEFNASKKETVHLLQIWIFPDKKGLSPNYEQRLFDPNGKRNRFRLIVSPKGEQGSIKIHQDALIYDAFLEKEKSFTYELKHDRGSWVQVTEGELKLAGHILKAGDGASIENESVLQFSTTQSTGFLFFDLV